LDHERSRRDGGGRLRRDDNLAGLRTRVVVLAMLAMRICRHGQGCALCVPRELKQ
jgi:hypothetical protein